jgi:DNA-binding GntR family transcriptional regulator
MDNPLAPYLQVANAIRSEISSGAITPGERLASVTELASRYGVAKMTVQKALGVLRAQGLVMAWQGRGTFVRDPSSADVTGTAAEDVIVQRLDAMMDEIQDLETRVARLEDRNPGRRTGKDRPVGGGAVSADNS